MDCATFKSRTFTIYKAVRVYREAKIHLVLHSYVTDKEAQVNYF